MFSGQDSGNSPTPTWRDFPWKLAAPSWVWPGTAGENCRRLEGLFPEVALLMLETESSLAYTERDLPPDLSDLDLSYHVHLPVDLPWSESMFRVRDVLEELLDKTARLDPWAYVLHAPPDPRLLDELAFVFIDRGIKPHRVLVENTAEFNPLEYWCDIRYLGFGLCLDLGHLILHGQERLLEVPRLWNRVRMLHLCAPGKNGEHLPLSQLDAEGRELMMRMISRMTPETCVVLELFDEKALFSSMRDLYDTAVRRSCP